ncbi:MAG: serine/threonine-protein kinase, partial [Planctomycetota bacterium]
MLAATLFRRPAAMAPQGPPTDEDATPAPAADEPPGKRPADVSASKQRKRRFQYATGDRPLMGYTIKRGVGRGGFGDVYFATSDAGKEVALKLVRRNFEVELRGVRQCLNLKHPNLVALYDVREDEGGDQWVVMEYVGGESLADAIERQPAGLPIDDALAWFRGTAAGVAHLHDAGIVHRDLKPANVYLEVGDAPIWQRVKVGDCGLSKFMTASRRSGQTESIGTVHYMAPEIASGRYGREVDLYALGVILYELLVGVPPFEGESVAEVLFKHVSAEPDLGRVPAPYRPAIAAALAKDPESRPSTVGALLAMLPGAASPTGTPAADGPATAAAHPDAAAGPDVWTPVSRPPHTDHPKPVREPLWAAMEEGVRWLTDQYRANPAPPLLKGLVLFGGVTLTVFSGAIAIPFAVLPFYLVYYVIWSAFV